VRTERLIAVLVLLIAHPVGPVHAEPHAASFRVIVNPGNPTSSADRQFLLDAFLKRVTRWENGDAIHTVDLNADSPVRRKFSAEVLGRSVTAVQSYWQQAIFSGRDVPPPELDSDEAVVQYVLRYPGALGYVSDAADVRAVKILGVR
jgi:ABC-type phosphate transport system substrate-binding protein